MNDSISIKQAVELLEQDGLLVGYDCPPQLLEHRFSHLSYSSADVTPDTFFICKGATFKEEYLRDAIAKGAGVYLAQSFYEGVDCPHILVSDIRKAMSLVSIAFYQKAYRNFRVVGLTGTKGKTTTTYFMKNILDAFCRRNPQLCAAQKSAVLSTVEVDTGIEHHEAHLTTPESPDLQRYFAQTRDSGLPILTMEVSSQALMLHRTQGFVFDFGIFTNLEPDHIGPNEHGSFEEYAHCKSLLFQQCRVGIANVDDVHWQLITKEHTCSLETYGMSENADLRAQNLQFTNRQGHLGIAFDVTGLMNFHAEIAMPGRFSVYNALTAIAICRHFKVSEADICKALLAAKVKGRIEMVKVSNEFTLMIDYAHNAMALKSLLTTLKEYEHGRLVCVFGCGGNRSRERRFEMGEVSGNLADFTIITSDNPRFEEPEAIIEDIITGMKKTDGVYISIPDRKEAIAYAIDHGQPGDIIVLAGKGHEDYQEIKGVKYPMDERDLIADILKERGISF